MSQELKIRHHFLGRIRHKEFDERQKLPSENELSLFYGVPRKVIRVMYTTLESMGYVESQQGIGHFLKYRKPQIELVMRGDVSFSQKMAELGVPLETVNLGCHRLDTAGYWPSLLEQGTDNIYEIARLRLVDDQPAAIHYSYLSQTRFPQIADEGASIRSVFSYYRSKGYASFKSQETLLSIDYPSPREQEILCCSDLVPLIVLESQCIDAKELQLLEVTRSIYRGDIFQYKINP